MMIWSAATSNTEAPGIDGSKDAMRRVARALMALALRTVRMARYFWLLEARDACPKPDSGRKHVRFTTTAIWALWRFFKA